MKPIIIVDIFKSESGPSLSPYGQTTPIYQERLRYPNTRDPERVMMGLWHDLQRRHPNIDFGAVPLDYITHRCTKKCRPAEGRHHFSGKIKKSDVEIAAATMQWLATPNGRAFLTTFFKSIGSDVVYNRKSPHHRLHRDQQKKVA